jgi:hypothetical protein
MPHRYKVFLLYAALLVAAFDLHALVQRIFSPSVDAVAWGKLALSALLQGLAFAGAYGYLRWFGRTGNALLSTTRFGRNLKLAPLVGSAVLAAFSTQVLYNAVNCGDYPFPSSNARSACPR